VYEQNTDPEISCVPVTPWDGQKGFWNAWNRFFYRFMGPAQNLPLRGKTFQEPNPHVACPRCGKPLSSHEFDRGGPGAMTYMYCPK